ncbi:MAG: alanine racemase, partial [Betaproteobacteria bacterium]|nr:alanine racemase [Betaproteobacteria bacterium]
MRPLKALINLENAKHNLNYVRSLAPSSKIMATLKANAYGHGLTLMAGAFNDADAFSVLTIEDAIEIREAGFDKKILLLEGAFDEEDLKIAAAYHFDLVVHNDYQLALLRQLPHDKRIDIHLKVNTGMNRLGFSVKSISKVYNQLKNDDRINEIVFMSHFANADKTNGTDKQYQEIEKLMNDYNEPFSLANSAALISDNKTHADWVRPGIMLYGASPFDFSQKIPN